MYALEHSHDVSPNIFTRTVGPPPDGFDTKEEAVKWINEEAPIHFHNPLDRVNFRLRVTDAIPIRKVTKLSFEL